MDTGKTLKEFIMDCGERFVSLDKVEEKWRAMGWKETRFDISIVMGITPEEAVQKLSDLLNKK